MRAVTVNPSKRWLNDAANEVVLAPRRWSSSSNAVLPPGQWLRAGALTVVNPGLPPSTAGEAPPGYVAWRRHWSTVQPLASCGYELRVLPADDSEESLEGTTDVRFRITPEHEADRPIEASSAAIAVEELYARLRRCQPALKHAAITYPTAPSYPFSAAFFFGWVLEPVQRRLHGLENERRDKNKVDVTSRNASGCARTEGVNWRRGDAPTDDPKLRPSKQQQGNCAQGGSLGGGSSLSQHLEKASYLQRELLPPGNIEKLRNLNNDARARFKVKRSNIHGMGLFVKQPIPKGEMLIEYQGSLIRSSLSERLNFRYKTIGDYIFRIDETTHVDATVAGNMARFMNHSCAPNCYSRVLEVGKGLGASGCSLDKHIVIYAQRDLQVFGKHRFISQSPVVNVDASRMIWYAHIVGVWRV